ncbi:hypothetical protein HZB96_04795 [Candidatus Gottesmanbacteria bacterium]|nr:hypothetical protein [Candidatus Gottesmanbacteria bacterium]MBI5452409.1 hypothetical protein [Candidatus Gottesmanbacteria bacterium]
MALNPPCEFHSRNGSLLTLRDIYTWDTRWHLVLGYKEAVVEAKTSH